MPTPLSYARTDLNRRATKHDGIPFLLGLIQLAAGFILLLIFLHDGWSVHLSKYWYEWPSNLWLSDGLECGYLISTCVLIYAAFSEADQRLRFYRIYFALWICGLAFTELCLMVLRPWPGERRFRWIAEHNLAHSSFVGSDSFLDYLIVILLASPAAVFILLRFIWKMLVPRGWFNNDTSSDGFWVNEVGNAEDGAPHV